MFQSLSQDEKFFILCLLIAACNLVGYGILYLILGRFNKKESPITDAVKVSLAVIESAQSMKLQEMRAKRMNENAAKVKEDVKEMSDALKVAEGIGGFIGTDKQKGDYVPSFSEKMELAPVNIDLNEWRKEIELPGVWELYRSLCDEVYNGKGWIELPDLKTLSLVQLFAYKYAVMYRPAYMKSIPYVNYKGSEIRTAYDRKQLHNLIVKHIDTINKDLSYGAKERKPDWNTGGVVGERPDLKNFFTIDEATELNPEMLDKLTKSVNRTYRSRVWDFARHAVEPITKGEDDVKRSEREALRYAMSLIRTCLDLPWTRKEKIDKLLKAITVLLRVMMDMKYPAIHIHKGNISKYAPAGCFIVNGETQVSGPDGIEVRFPNGEVEAFKYAPGHGPTPIVACGISKDAADALAYSLSKVPHGPGTVTVEGDTAAYILFKKAGIRNNGYKMMRDAYRFEGLTAGAVKHLKDNYNDVVDYCKFVPNADDAEKGYYRLKLTKESELNVPDFATVGKLIRSHIAKKESDNAVKGHERFELDELERINSVYKPYSVVREEHCGSNGPKVYAFRYREGDTTEYAHSLNSLELALQNRKEQATS